MKVLIAITSIIVLTSCNSCSSIMINENTSEISFIVANCLEDSTWNEVLRAYSTDSLDDSIFIEKVEEIKGQSFDTDVIFFKDSPKELIAISKDRYSIRYVYNPNLSTEVLNGFSLLNGVEKKRIAERVHKVLSKYQCKDGIIESNEYVKGIN